MTSKASSAQPNAAAIRVLRCAEVVPEKSGMNAGILHDLQHAAEMEVTTGPMDVFGDLRAQRIDIRPFHLRAEVLQEGELDRRLGGDLNRMEVQQVRFNGQRFFAASRPRTDVG